jgi:death-on-curing protein
MKKWIWIETQSVIGANAKLVRGFGGRTGGLRDEALLESALARPANLAAYEHPDIYDLATAYVFGLIQNHPFIDGNKRTAFIAMLIFLTNNGLSYNANDVETYAAIMGLARKEISEKDFAVWLKSQTKKIKA